MKAIGLLSGGLDSTIAAKLILDQGVEVVALKFTSPFCQCDRNGKCCASDIASQLNIELKTISKGEEFLSVIKNPKHGYGRGMNPCIDCRIFMLKKAKEYAQTTGADFIFTGEVLGQRPMSQHRQAMQIIEKESGLEGKLVRPLSAQFFNETEAEKNGWVDRTQFLNISGRGRGRQLDLVEGFHLKGYACPAGGCLLTDINFAGRLRDHIKHEDDLTYNDIALLKFGRHFRIENTKIIAGKNMNENNRLMLLKKENDIAFSSVSFPGPVVILRKENRNRSVINTAAEIAASYSDCSESSMIIQLESGDIKENIIVQKKERSAFKDFKI